MSTSLDYCDIKSRFSLLFILSVLCSSHLLLTLYMYVHMRKECLFISCYVPHRFIFSPYLFAFCFSLSVTRLTVLSKMDVCIPTGRWPCCYSVYTLASSCLVWPYGAAALEKSGCTAQQTCVVEEHVFMLLIRHKCIYLASWLQIKG